MNILNGSFEMLNDMTNQELGKSEIPKTTDYQGEKSFIEAFSDSIKEFIDSVIEVFDSKSPEAKECDEALTEKAAEVLAEVFDTNTISEWGSMSMEAREAKLSEYYSELGKVLGIDAKGVIIEDCEATVGEGVLGYNSGDGYLHIDYKNLQDPSQLMEVLNTTTHEARHQLQSEAIADPSRFPEFSTSLISEWEHNMQNYDSGEFGIEGYYNQVVEVDARVFAADVINAFSDILNL